ncbi:MAG: methyltransferase domain-containing protein [Henriciella sp.]|jgi:protein-L-isoaspartate(D-aspartate) O-methyltransferase
MADLVPDPFRAARLVLSLRRQGITDDAVLTALETVDRGVFVSPGLASMGGEDCSLPIACGQSIPRPVVTARLLRALALSLGKEERVLLVGSGSGYTAALLAQISRHVYGIERYAALAELSRARLTELKVDNVTIRHGDGLSGLSEHGPFDRILLTGSVKTIPAALVDQLTRGGLLIASLVQSDGSQILRTVTADKSIKDQPMPEPLAPLTKGAALTL